jgi:hypothetical protein
MQGHHERTEGPYFPQEAEVAVPAIRICQHVAANSPFLKCSADLRHAPAENKSLTDFNSAALNAKVELVNQRLRHKRIQSSRDIYIPVN